MLALVETGDRYGYELVQAISAKVAISEGAVYPLLRRLTSEGYFTTYLKESAEGPPRKYYAITEQGKNHLDELRAEWEAFTAGVNELIKRGDDK
ncbi:transcriptional regulator PadR-like family protein [Exiguobacterium sp. S17]|nr:transcriptional regulator PadR-like family protein [Exiguobacterium sp. S17]